MPLVPVVIADGQVSGVDDLATTASSVVNWDIDEAGINRPRATLQAYTQTGLGAYPVVGLAEWQSYALAACYDATKVTDNSTTGYLNLRIYIVNGVFPTVVQEIVPPNVGALGLLRPTFVSAASKLYMAAGGYIHSWVSTAPTTLTNTGAGPSKATHIASLDQRLIANDLANPSNYYWSDIGEGVWTSWPTANTSQAEARPDPIVALAENTNELLIWGTQTTQSYVVGSDPTLPFDVVSTINTGIGAPYAYCRLDDRWSWLDDRLRIVMGDGRGVESIGDAIQKDIRGLSTVDDAFAYRLEYDQFSHLVYRFPTAQRTFAYNLKSQKWTERETYAAPVNADHAVGAYIPRQYDGSHLFGLSRSTGGLATLSTSIGSELAGPLVCERTTGWNDFGTTNSKRYGRLRVVMRRGTAVENADPGALEVQYQDDDSAWSPWQQLSVGTPSQFESVQDLWLAGIGRRRRYRVRFSTTERFALAEMHQDFDDLGRP